MNDPARIWVVDDDHGVRFVLATALREAGHDVRAFTSAEEAWAAMASGAAPDLLFTDVRMPGEGGLALLERLKAAHADLPVVVMSAYTDVASTAGAFRGGAFEYLSKPFDLDEAVALAARALEETRGDAAADAPSQPAPPPEADIPPMLIGHTPAMRALFRSIGRVAQAPLNVLITGETGTGKELVARAVHAESPRAGKPFVALNTAAIPAELLESELFGHEAGAFTGANRRHVGRFEQADGGTLFLDEIGDMPAALQTRLLRVLAEGEFFRVGGRELIRVDVRIIAATHQPLARRVEEGGFRADLLHRLDVVRLAVPLRERRDDIAPLAEDFIARAARRLGVKPKTFAKAALQRLQQHDWPGNVRELENLCWRVVAMAPGERIGIADLGDGLRLRETGAEWEHALAAWVAQRLEAGESGLHAQARERLDQVLLDAALAASDGHRGQAAERLGLGRNTVTRKLGASRRRRGQRSPD